jgi:uroporphyrinogen decarboxylase
VSVPMTHAENFRELLQGGRPSWIPFTLDVGAVPGFTAPVAQRFHENTAADDPAEYFDFDFRTLSLTSRFGGDDPRRLHETVEPGTMFDEWGIGHWAGGAEATYERNYAPLAVARTIRDVETLPTPIIDTNIDVARIAGFRKRGYPVFGYAGSIYEWSWWLRGMADFMMDLVSQPALAEAIIRKVTMYTQKLARYSARLGIDVLCFYDDVGMQTGMQLSPDLWRKFIKPRWKEVVQEVRREVPDIPCFLHSCGNVTEIIPDIVELGFNILHPLQPECIDVVRAKREYGQDIVICATLSAQRVFPFGSPEDVRNEVRRLKRECGDDNRCILCPSNAVQPETPWENILAFVAEARAER